MCRGTSSVGSATIPRGKRGKSRWTRSGTRPVYGRSRRPPGPVTGEPHRERVSRMDVEWELREAGPPDAEHTVLLLPGGLCGAGSYAEVMAQPALAGMRLVAATLPGHAGAPPPDDYSVE